MSAQADLTGRVFVVTGGGSGIGAAAAAELADRGASVVAVDIRAEPNDLGTGGAAGVVLTYGDVSSYPDMQRLRDEVLAAYGRVDVVIANAGITARGEVLDADPDSWPRVLETNVLGAAYVTKAFIADLVGQGSGHVVITSSISGRVAYRGEPMYIASKWALVGFGRALRKEVAGAGVKVTLIEPGIVNTPLVDQTPEGRQELAEVEALTAGEVADAIVFAVTRSKNVDVDELVLSPIDQGL